MSRATPPPRPYSVLRENLLGRIEDAEGSRILVVTGAAGSGKSTLVRQVCTLEPGDVIATGTPAGVGAARREQLRSGDVVRVEVEGLAPLENPVRLRSEAPPPAGVVPVFREALS